MFASLERSLGLTILIDEHAAQSEPCRTPLAVTHLDELALALEHLGGQLAAVFAGHRPLHALDNGGHRTAVILELFGAVLDLNTGALADVLVVRTLIGILEPAPPADVVDEDRLVVHIAGLNILEETLERVAPLDAQAALPLVGVGTDDLVSACLGVLANHIALVLGGVLLVLR